MPRVVVGTSTFLPSTHYFAPGAGSIPARRIKEVFMADFSLSYCREALSRLMDEEKAVLSALGAMKRLFGMAFPLKEGKALKRRLTGLNTEKDSLARELELLLSCLKRNRALPLITRDPSPWNVALGSVYGMCVCLSETEELLYIREKDGGVEPGHMVQTQYLSPLSGLSESWQHMVLKGLLRRDDLPGYARELINKRIKEEKKDVS